MTEPLVYILVTAAALTASVISGTAGFGGAILLLPALTALLGIEKALPLLALAQLVGNSARALLGFRSINWHAVACFAGGAAPLGVLATLTLVTLPQNQVRFAAGSVILLVALLELGVVFALLPGFINRLKPPQQPGLWLSIAGALVGTISAIAGSTGPLPNAFFLRLKLTPAAYVATDAAAMGILHATKLSVFGLDTAWSLPAWELSGLVAAAMVTGTWLGRSVLGRLEEIRYRRYVAIWMLVVALSMFFVQGDLSA